jgi:hypothetical protein
VLFTQGTTLVPVTAFTNWATTEITFTSPQGSPREHGVCR